MNFDFSTMLNETKNKGNLRAGNRILEFLTDFFSTSSYHSLDGITVELETFNLKAFGVSSQKFNAKFDAWKNPSFKISPSTVKKLSKLQSKNPSMYLPLRLKQILNINEKHRDAYQTKDFLKYYNNPTGGFSKEYNLLYLSTPNYRLKDIDGISSMIKYRGKKMFLSRIYLHHAIADESGRNIKLRVGKNTRYRIITKLRSKVDIPKDLLHSFVLESDYPFRGLKPKR